MPSDPLHKPIRRKGKTPAAANSRAPGGLPVYASRGYDEVDKDILEGFAPKPEDELAFLKRLKLRSEISHVDMSQYMPPPSDLEVVTGNFMTSLGKISKSNKKEDKLTMLLLREKFNTSSEYNIAQQLARMRLESQSVKAVAALVEGKFDTNVKGFADLLIGEDANDVTGVKERIAMRVAMAATVPRGTEQE